MLPPVAADPSCYARTVNDWICPAYLTDRSGELVDATVEHLLITGSAVVLGLLVAFPMALLAQRSRRTQSGVLGLSTALYTVPSLALFPLLVPFTGLTATTVVVGLALYSLTILVRAMIDGLGSVDQGALDAATGMGLGPVARLWRVRVPLALPTMIAGLRVATVSTVALTTVGALVSYGGLGNLLYNGVQTDFKAQVLAASVLCLVIAFVLDALILVLGRLAAPWSRSVVA
ncbi:ABC transporter permease [Nocardioidaceae bacterium]|nr:ABC transporter permease [Nocardioidaceae bacterium]